MNIHTKDIDKDIVSNLSSICLSLFNKNMLGIFSGSISARIDTNTFLINRQNAIFNAMNTDSFIMLHDKEDYRWQEANLDKSIHANIYRNFLEARFIIVSNAPFSTSFSLKTNTLKPLDYWGSKILGKECPILDSKEYSTFYERAETEIARFLKINKMHFALVRGVGIYAYGRDLNNLVRTICAIEDSCRIAHYAKLIAQSYDDEYRFNI